MNCVPEENLRITGIYSLLQFVRHIVHVPSILLGNIDVGTGAVMTLSKKRR